MRNAKQVELIRELYHIWLGRVKWYAQLVNRNLLAYLVVLVGGLLGMLVYVKDANNIDRDRAIVQCERVNALRGQSNIADIIVWRNFSSAVQREAKLADVGGPGAGTHRDSADEIARNAQRLSITPLTDCKRAIDSPGRYKAPVATPLGDIRTGEEFPAVADIESQSLRAVARADE